MNRTIKFRALNTKTKRMLDCYKSTPLAVHPDLLKEGLDGVFIPFHKDLIIEQFTGLLDKSGMEIYEGDFLKSYQFTDRKKRKHYLYHSVVWSHKYSGWHVCAQGEEHKPEEDRQGSGPLWVYLKNSPDAIVGGNIHEGVEQ